MKKLCCLLALLCLFNSLSSAQFILLSSGDSDLVVCGDSETLEVEILLLEEYQGSLQLEIDFPEGILFESGSQTLQSGNANLELSQDDPDKPSFAISIDETLAAGDAIKLELQRKAVCSAIDLVQSGEVLEDVLRLQFTGGEIDDFGDAYEILYGALSVSLAPPQYFAAGIADTQWVEIVNGGLACVSEFVLTQYVPEQEIEMLGAQLGGMDYPYLQDGPELSIEVDASALEQAGFDGCLEPGEALQIGLIKRSGFCLDALDLTYNNWVTWGCSEQQCNNSQSQESNVFVINEAEFINDLIITAEVEPIGECEWQKYRFTITDPSFPSPARVGVDRLELGNRTGITGFQFMGFSDKRLDYRNLQVNGVSTTVSTFTRNLQIVTSMNFSDEFGSLTFEQDTAYVIEFEAGINFGSCGLGKRIEGMPMLELSSVLHTLRVCPISW